jgi:hypothetical protein
MSAFGLARPRKRNYRFGTERPPYHYPRYRHLLRRRHIRQKSQIVKKPVVQLVGSPQMSETEARKILEVELVDGVPQFDKLVEVCTFLHFNFFNHFYTNTQNKTKKASQSNTNQMNKHTNKETNL